MSEILFKATVENSPWESFRNSFKFVIKSNSKNFIIIDFTSNCECKPSVNNKMSIYWYFYMNLDSSNIPENVWKWLKDNLYYHEIIDHVHHDIDWLTDLYDNEDKTELIEELCLFRTKNSLKLLISEIEKGNLERCPLDFKKIVYDVNAELI